MKRPAWTQRKERSNRSLMRAMSWLSLRLGRRLSRIVLKPAAVYFLLFSPAACKASRDYLARALGRPAGWLDVLRHLTVFGSTIHDRIYLLNDRFDLFDLRVHGQPVMADTLAEGRGAFLIGAHLGSFEVIRAIGRTQPDLRVAITMYEENARRISEILASINPAAKPDVIALGQVDSMLKVREHLDAGSLIGMRMAWKSLRSSSPPAPCSATRATRCAGSSSSAHRRRFRSGRCIWPPCCGAR